MMFGFACDETPELMPAPIQYAHNIVRRLATARKQGTCKWLRPDGKSQVTVQYDGDRVKRVHTVVVSCQHSEEVDHERIADEVREVIVEEAIPQGLIDKDTIFHINPTGRFVLGGPQADAGLTGRKIIVDTYGGYARHGGGCFSGKDPSKVDRSGAYAARWVAKNIVAAGLAHRCEVQLAYAIGVVKPVSVRIDTYGTEKVELERLHELVDHHFDLSPFGIIKDLDLRRPIFQQTAAYGHFGRSDLDLPWEQTEKAAVLAEDAGLALPDALVEPATVGRDGSAPAGAPVA
jgi:S-adenosylmethionine synthetase